MTTIAIRDTINENFRVIFREMLRITDLARQTGASIDEVRYIERKGFITSVRIRLKQRAVRQYQDSEVRTVALIIKYRRQGFTWDTALKKAMEEMTKPSLF